MTTAFVPATVADDQLNVPQGPADLICKSNHMGSPQLCMNNTEKLQKPITKRSRNVAADSSTRSSSCRKQKVAANNTNKFGSASRSSSKYRGVTRHRWTGRYEAHLWDKNSWNQSQSKKGRQVYLGAYDNEDTAAHAYDLAALKYWGSGTILNFPVGMYDKEIEEMQRHTREEYIASLRRKSNGFSRGVSKYRGVARHHHNGRWEARIGRVYGNKYLYLGTYSTQEEAAIAYDIAALQYRGLHAVTNFDMSNYLRCMQPSQLMTSHDSSSLPKDTTNNSDSINTAASSSGGKNPKAPVVPQATCNNQINFSLDHPFPLDHQNPLLQLCVRTSCAGSQMDHQGKDENHNNVLIMKLENMLGTSSDHLNLIHDQVSATSSVPSHVDHLQHPSADAYITSYNVDNYLHQVMTPTKTTIMGDAYDPNTHLNTTYHLEKLMAEYKELLQSPKPKEILNKGTLSAIVDTLSDTASSATTCSSLSSTVQTSMGNEYLNHIKIGGFLDGLLSPQKECTKYVDQIFDILDMVPGTTDSICSSNDLSSIQDLVNCNNITDMHCNNAMYSSPFHFNCISSDGLILDSSLRNNMASLLPSTLNILNQHYLQK